MRFTELQKRVVFRWKNVVLAENYGVSLNNRRFSPKNIVFRRSKRCFFVDLKLYYIYFDVYGTFLRFYAFKMHCHAINKLMGYASKGGWLNFYFTKNNIVRVLGKLSSKSFEYAQVSLLSFV